MTPREKAIELVNIFKESCKNDIFSDWDYVFKRNALIAVDQIIEALKVTTGHLDLSRSDVNEVAKDIMFWQDVRKEIEKL